MQNTLIVTGGKINKSFLKKHLKENEYDYIIASDKGLEVLDKCAVKPNQIIGDFDSLDKKVLNKYNRYKDIEIIKLNPIKDYTDTDEALKHAIEIKSTSITILGAIGSRVDHLIANINILKKALDKNISCTILNEKNKIFLINKNTTIKKEKKYPFISLIPLTTLVTGITLRGFKYSLENDIISIGQSIGISNEQLKDEAEIKIKDGILIIIKSRD